MRTYISGADLTALTVGGTIALALIAVLMGRSAAATDCNALRSYNGTGVDASAVIKWCINETPSGGILEFPAGRYAIASQIRVTKPITLRTTGLSPTDERCSTRSPSLCAELYALPSFRDRHGLLYVERDGTSVDHIVLDGNKAGRAEVPGGAARDCASGDTEMGRVVYWIADHSSITNSVVKNALCGTGLGIGRNRNVSVKFNTITANGTHDQHMMWADGLTAYDLSDSTIQDNHISDNTDVDFVLGGCRNCIVTGNTITHSPEFSSSSFAALVIHAWPGSSGDYGDAEFSHNRIDCGPEKRCGFGISIGAGPWYKSKAIVGAVVHDNFIANAQMGFNIDPASTQDFQVEVYDNLVTGSAGVTPTGCDARIITFNYNITPADSGKIVRTRDKIPSSAYGNLSWGAGCIPNFSKPELASFVPSSKGAFIVHLYRCVLHREPDELGLTKWLAMPRSTSILSLYQEFFSSPEYLARTATDMAYIEHLYLCTLFRAPSELEVNERVQGLARGGRRSDIVADFIGSAEFQQTIGRELTAATGFTLW